MTMSKLDAYLSIWNDLQELFTEDVAITLFNKNEILAYRPGKGIDTGAKVGDRPNPNSNVIEAMTSGHRVLRKVPKEVFGVPFVGVACPIEENGYIIGCIAVATSIERYETLINAGNAILDYASKIAEVAQNFSAGAEELASTVENLNENSSQVSFEMKQTSTVTGKIRKISMQSKILGLNAAIEASRAGEQGRGFSVVAEEVRKLADTTNESTQEIETNVMQAQLSVNSLIDAIHELGQIVESQAMGATEIANALKQIEEMANDLVLAGEQGNN